MYAAATISVRSIPLVRSKIAEQMTYALHGQPERYEWDYIRKGDFWFEDEEGVHYADEDLVHLVALREWE